MDQRVTRTKPKSRAKPLDDIVDDIVCVLGDVEGKTLVLPEDETRAKVRLAIKDSTKFFHYWDVWCSRKGHAAVAKDARELAGLIAPLESKLRRLTDPLADYLFGPPIARHALMPVEDIRAATLAGKEALLERLGRLRLDCRRQQSLPRS